MKSILCFGDSNTHGYIPGGGRYEENVRWPGVLAELLGPDYRIIEEGLNGRTSCQNDPTEPYRNAMDYIIPCLMSHEPLNLTILMLGSNDMKQRFSPSLEKITTGLRLLTRTIQAISQAPVLLVSPILLGEHMAFSPFGPSFPPESVALSHQLGSALREMAEELGTFFLNAADYAAPSEEDSLHLTAEGHRALAHAICNKVKEIL